MEAVAIEGLPAELCECNGVYLPAGDKGGWPRFHSAQGTHLYYSPKRRAWLLHDKADGDAELSAVSAYVSAVVFAATAWALSTVRVDDREVHDEIRE